MAQIYASDWNPLVISLHSILLGWGQSYSSYAVTTNTTPINHLDYNAVIADINACYTHITGSNSALTTVPAGTQITQARLTNASAAVSYITSNRYKASVSQLTQSVIYNSGNVAYSPWSNYYSATFTLTWTDNTTFKRFFDGGGGFFVNLTGTAGGTSQGQSWVDLLTNSGALALTRDSSYQQGQTWNGTFGFSGASNIASIPQAWFVNTGLDANYTSNTLTINVTGNGDYNSCTQMTFQVYLSDAHTATGGGPDTVTGSIQLVATQRYPFTYSMSSWTLTSQTQS
jgi:hypothetical protein